MPTTIRFRPGGADVRALTDAVEDDLLARCRESDQPYVSHVLKLMRLAGRNEVVLLKQDAEILGKSERSVHRAMTRVTTATDQPYLSRTNNPNTRACQRMREDWGRRGHKPPWVYVLSQKAEVPSSKPDGRTCNKCQTPGLEWYGLLRDGKTRWRLRDPATKELHWCPQGQLKELNWQEMS